MDSSFPSDAHCRAGARFRLKQQLQAASRVSSESVSGVESAVFASDASTTCAESSANVCAAGAGASPFTRAAVAAFAGQVRRFISADTAPNGNCFPDYDRQQAGFVRLWPSVPCERYYGYYHCADYVVQGCIITGDWEEFLACPKGCGVSIVLTRNNYFRHYALLITRCCRVSHRGDRFRLPAPRMAG